MSAAAKHLRISQPSLSSQLKVLERSFELRLFQRVGRNNRLTPAGSVIYGFCRQMFELSEQMGELLSERVPSASRRIQIGVTDEVDRPFVIEVVSLFLRKHGHEQRPKVTVISGTHEQLAERLRFREIDAVVTQHAMMDPDLENLSRAEVPVALVCSSKWKMRTKRKKLKATAALQEIIGGENAQWLMPSSHFRLRTEINQFIEMNALKGRIVFESDVIASLVRAVIDGIGLSFVPLIYVARDIREKTVQVIGPKKGYWRYRVWLTCHRQNINDALILALSRSFKEVCDRASG